MNKEPAQYEISTLKDIFEKVPADKIEKCCREIGEGLTCMKRFAEAADQLVEASGEGGATPAVVLELPIVWVDDNGGASTLNMTGEGGLNLGSMSPEQLAEATNILKAATADALNAQNK